MSFMVFPPEFNSAMMYSGAGSGPLMAAASAWDELAADLETTAASYQAVVTQLTGGPWLGAASARMASAAAPYIAWLEGSSVQAATTGLQAKMAAAAYEGAFAATVPPAVIAANRALLAALVATNFLGQNTPAIAATEAHYMEMWFQDGVTMDTYAAASQQATALPQQTAAPNTSDGGASANAAATAQSTANSASSLGTDLQSLLNAYLGNIPSGQTLAGDWTSVLSDVGVTGTVANNLVSALTSGVGTAVSSTSGDILPFQAAYYVAQFASTPVRMLMSLAQSMSASQALQAGQQAMLANVSHLVEAKMQGLMAGISAQMRGAASAISAQLASASRLGGLSVPHAWASGAPEMARAAPVLPETSISPQVPVATLPNSPYTQALMGALNGRGVGAQAAKTAPVKVETRSPAGG
jgi:PPE-repeat protein